MFLLFIQRRALFKKIDFPSLVVGNDGIREKTAEKAKVWYRLEKKDTTSTCADVHVQTPH